MFYILTIIIASIIIGAVNYIVNFAAFDYNAWNIIFCVVISVIGAIAIDSLFATIVRWLLPKKWFSVDKKRWAAKRSECLFYEKIGIKKWKDKVIDLGAVTGFRKNKIAEPTSNVFVARYIVEANYGVLVHIACIIFGYLACLIFPYKWYSVGLFVGFVNMVLNGLALMTLRYNLPKLHTLYRINARREICRTRQVVAEENIEEISA